MPNGNPTRWLLGWRALVVIAIALGAALGACETSDGPAAETEPASTDRPPAGSPPATRPAPPTAGPATTPEPWEWTTVPDAPVALTEVAGAAHDGRGWVVGGLLADGTAASQVLAFDPLSDAWTQGPPLPRGIHHTSLVSTGDELYVVGGLEGDYPGAPTANVLRLDDDGRAWVPAPSLPEPRGAGAAAWDGRRLVYGGGLGPAGEVADDVWALEDGAWRRLGSLSAEREHLAATSDGDGRTWFLGGRQIRLATNVGTVDVVDGDEIRGLDAELTPRSGVAAFWSAETGPCLAGGEGPAGTHAEVECVGGDGDVQELPGLRVARHGLGAAVIDGVVYVLLGGERPGLYVSAVGERLELRDLGR